MNRVTWRRVAPAARSSPTLRPARPRSPATVEHEERASEQRDRGDQRRRCLEIGGRGAQGRGDLLGRGQDVRLEAEPILERRGDGRGIRAGRQAEVDPGQGRLPEHGLRRLVRHDHDPPERAVERAVAGEDPDDAEGDPVARALHGQG
jgi:hypothetical protein